MGYYKTIGGITIGCVWVWGGGGGGAYTHLHKTKKRIGTSSGV